MSNFDSSALFLGCGVDEEIIERFEKCVSSRENPMSMVFSHKEFDYILSLPGAERAVAYTAAFCCKESLYKASGCPFNFNAVSFLYHEKSLSCISYCPDDLFCENGLIIKSIENRISIWDSICCTAQLYLTAQHKEI